MIYLVLAVACSLAIGAIFKHAAEIKLDRMHLLLANYLAAALCAGLGIYLDGPATLAALLETDFLIFGVVSGVVLIGAFFVYALATARAGMSLTISVTRVGVAIPFLVSWLVWEEVPGLAQWSGLALVGAALFLITRPRDSSPRTRSHGKGAPRARSRVVVPILVLCFFAGGLGDLMFKAFDAWHASRVTLDGFIFVAFGTSFLVALAVVVAGSDSSGVTRLPTLLWGALLGVINYASVLFILEAVARLPGTVVFPTHAVSAVVGGALIGAFVWRENLSRLNMAGVAVAAVAVLLLNG